MVSLLAMALHLAATDPAEARSAYMSCLGAFARESAKQAMEENAFDAALSNACANEEAAFRKAALAYDLAHGISRRTSEGGIEDEVKDIRFSAKDRFLLDSESARPPE